MKQDEEPPHPELEIEIFRLVSQGRYSLEDPEGLVHEEQMHDESVKRFDLSQQIVDLRASGEVGNERLYRLYATYVKWGGVQEDERLFYTRIRRKL